MHGAPTEQGQSRIEAGAALWAWINSGGGSDDQFASPALWTAIRTPRSGQIAVERNPNGKPKSRPTCPQRGGSLTAPGPHRSHLNLRPHQAHRTGVFLKSFVIWVYSTKKTLRGLGERL